MQIYPEFNEFGMAKLATANILSNISSMNSIRHQKTPFKKRSFTAEFSWREGHGPKRLKKVINVSRWHCLTPFYRHQ
jgi:hypothetical protein